MKKLSSVLFLMLFTFCLQAQDTNTSSLSIKQIMDGDDFVGHLPSRPQWSLDGNSIYFQWNPDNAWSDSLYVYDVKSKKINKAGFETDWNLPNDRMTTNAEGSKALYEKHGDIFITDLKTGKITQVTNTTDRERSAHFTNNYSAIAYVSGNDLYTWDIASGRISQLTNFTDRNKRAVKRSDKDEWLYQDQLELFDVLKERKAKRDAGDSLAYKDDLKRPLPLYTNGKSVYGQMVSPDGDYVTYLSVDRPDNKGTIVPHFVTESGYTEDQNTRSKVGDKPAEYEMFVYDIKNRKSYPVKLDNLEGLDYIPEYTKDYPDKEYKNENRIGNIGGPVWSSDGKYALLNIISNDWKDRWIVLLNPEDGTVTNLDHQHDTAWIAGPGIGGYGMGDMGWMPDDKSFWYISEKTGYAHLYAMEVTSKKAVALTSGDFEIYDPFISKDKKYWYLTANPDTPGIRHFYRMPLKGGKMMQLTTEAGNNAVTLSPDEKKMAIMYSFANKPTELYISNNPAKGGKFEMTPVTQSTTKAFEAYDWRTPEFITFKADDGASVHARLYTPEASKKNKAAVIFVHGAGYLQNAHQWWSSYFREYMFHNILVDNGYTVLDIDYRGSAGYGRDWRTGIYRHMGGKDLSDQVDGAEFLVSEHGVDADKIGIYGGSYGGFITLMALFKNPETFKAGGAIRSVGDWAAYNHGYTSRILNTPVNDPIAYKQSSPIYFANGLEGDLLILHGMVDDNVHFQDMVRLSQKLIELGKENWEMAVYPVERHGFVEPSSWTDEYKRIFKLFQSSLLGIE
ncbi:prolyl oligopeptidase family serine peptidase [Robertkochia solimangrovi]|uniref:prolyl oligopeptidase family serine peptidase n=1 Tax=Robertkochia solimangrovi TaxID=2213046 RepID=UPI00117F37EC|nr:prolyl oligopeptidase family serine peptidase [Robertkochia solimangrovi]TRZ44459.1 S9 family peptidase [Robertkochia solimangrovi]